MRLALTLPDSGMVSQRVGLFCYFITRPFPRHEQVCERCTVLRVRECSEDVYPYCAKYKSGHVLTHCKNVQIISFMISKHDLWLILVLMQYN